MARHAKVFNAPAHPWRRVARTMLAIVPAFAALAPVIYQQATQHDPAAAAGAVGTALFIAGAITRVLGNADVEVFLRRFAPWLAAGDVELERVVAVTMPHPVLDGPPLIAAGPAHPAVTGTRVRLPEVAPAASGPDPAVQVP